jgi:acetylglutamate kinase
MVLNGSINTRILAICRELDIEAIGISGVDAGLIRAHKRAPVPAADGSGGTVDYGFVGDIERVNSSVLEKLLADGLMPVVSPLSADSNGTLLNINADTVAAALGGALAAEKLVLCTGAPGILERLSDPTSIISYTDVKGLKRLRETGCLRDGDRERDPRRRAPRARHLLQVRRQPARGDLHQRGHRHDGGRGPGRLEPGRTTKRADQRVSTT